MRRFLESSLIEILALAAIVGAAACSTIDTHTTPPADWPALKVSEHYVPHAEMRSRCAPYVAWHASPEGCAVIRFDERRCDIWLSKEFPPAASTLEHERLHCGGYEHPGEGALRDAWALWKAKS